MPLSENELKLRRKLQDEIDSHFKAIKDIANEWDNVVGSRGSENQGWLRRKMNELREEVLTTIHIP